LTLHGRFLLRELIATDSTVQTWAGDDLVAGRAVVVKVLPDRVRGSVSSRTAMWRQLQAVTGLTHPHLMAVRGYGEIHLPDGVRAYLVVQPAGGAKLVGLLAAGTMLAWPRAGRIVAQIASGMAAAHAVDLPHSGISPHCVLVSGGEAKLADVGLAILTAASRDAKLYTADAMAADVFALGALLHTAVTGHPPAPDYSATTTKHDLVGYGRVPAGVIDLLGECLAAEPAARPTAAQVAARLALLAESDRFAFDVDSPIVRSSAVREASRRGPVVDRRDVDARPG